MNSSNYPKDFQDAIFQGNIPKTDSFLAQGFSVNAQDEKGYAPLYDAVRHAHLEVISFLLDKGANINLQCVDDYTALHFAVSDENIEILSFLLKRGADPNIPDDDGNTPLFTALQNYDEDEEPEPKIIKLLLENGAKSNVMNFHGVLLSQSLTMPKNKALVGIFGQYEEEMKSPVEAKVFLPQTQTSEKSSPSDEDPKYFEIAKFLWKTYVPKSGQAETVQGELIRAVEKLRDEGTRNGNINWDIGFEILAEFLEHTLCTSKVFSDKVKQQIKEYIQAIKNYEYPVTDDEIYDFLINCVVEWYLKNQEPIPKVFNPNLYR